MSERRPPTSQPFARSPDGEWPRPPTLRNDTQSPPADSAGQFELTIVVLCYRTEERVIPLVEEPKRTAARLTDRCQLVLDGNCIRGSNDRTGDVVRRLASNDPHIKAVVRPKKGMTGWDMRKGLQAAEGSCLCVIDGDGQFPIEAIRHGYALLRGNNLDMVTTCRRQRNDGLYRRMMSRAYNVLFHLLFPGLPAADANSKPKMFTRAATRGCFSPAVTGSWTPRS